MTVIKGQLLFLRSKVGLSAIMQTKIPDYNMNSPELDPASVVLGRPPLEADHPHGGRLAAVCDRGLEPLAAVEILRLGEVTGVRQVGDVPRAHVPHRPSLSTEQEPFECSPASDGDPEVGVGSDPGLVHDKLHWRVT